MNKAELTAAIVKKTGFTKKDAEKAIAAVTDVITETLASTEEEPVKAELKKRVIQDLIPQIHWDKYEKLLVDAKKDGERKKAAESTGGAGGADTASGGDGLGGDAGGDTAFN